MPNFMRGLVLLASSFLYSITAFSDARSFNNIVFQSSEDSLKILAMISEADSLKGINYKQALSIGQQALEAARRTKSLHLIKKALSINALLDWYDGEHKRGLERSKEGLHLSQILNDTFGIASNYNMIGLIYLYKSEYDSALKYQEKALETYVSLADTTHILKVYGFIGLNYNLQADYIRGKENLLSSVVIRRRFNAANWNILNIPESKELLEKYYTESLINAKKALLDFRDQKLPSIEKRFAYHNVGLAYLNLGRPDSALYYFKPAVTIAEKLGMDVYWNELARAYKELNLYDSSIWAAEQALANATDHGTRINQAISYSSLGKTFAAQAKFKEAISVYQKSLHLDQLMGHRYSQMNTMRWIAEVALSNNDALMALAYADSTIAIASKIGARKGYVQGLKVQVKGFGLMNNFKTALQIEEEYDSLLEILQKGKTQLDLAKMDLFNDVQLKQLEIVKLNQQQALSKANLKNRTLQMIIILIVGFFVVLLLLLNYLRTRNLLRLNKKLNTQQDIIGEQNEALAISNSEKEVLLGEIHHRVKNNLQVISSLLSVQSLQLKDETARQAVLEGQHRVQTMGLIHESLYQDDNFAEIDMQSYLDKLVYNLIASFGYSPTEIDLSIMANEINMKVDIAINLGLVTNELVTNVLKHAFSNLNENKKLQINLFYLQTRNLCLEVKDNGLNNNKKVEIDKSSSFGLKLVKQIIKKYKGEIIFKTEKGTEVKVTLFLD